MDRSEVVTLVKTDFNQNNIGEYMSTETYKDVFASIQSISQSEFFEAGRNGLNPQYKVVMFKYDYDNEVIVEYSGKRYAVYRTYEVRNDSIELYLQIEGGATHG